MIWVRRGNVCVMLFFKRIRSVNKARGIGVRLQEGFCIRPWANKRNREILKWVTPKADTDISSKKRTLPGWDREKILLASKFYTSKQWKRLSGRDGLWQQEQNQSLCSGKQGSKGCHMPSPDASSLPTQHLIYMEIPPILRIFQKKRLYSFSHPTPSV